jgi:PAS domain S-box-containing protein
VTAVTTLIDQALLVHAVDRSPDGVLIVDEVGIIHFANRSMAVLAGRDAEEFVGRSVDELVPADLRPSHAAHRRSFNRAPTQRPMGSGLELMLVRRDGTLVPVEISLSPLQHEGTQFVIAAVRDVSERKEAQRRLSAATEQLTLAHERERIGRDLHDVILQHLYGMGLSLQAIATAFGPEGERLDTVIDDIDRIISEVRTIVFTLGTPGRAGSLGQELADVMAQASRVLGFTPSMRLEGPVETVITADIRSEMVASMREALGNVARHAGGATKATVVVEVAGDRVAMTVSDNGTGPPADVDLALRGGHGLANLRTRAESLGGTCTLAPGDGGGAMLHWSVPFHDR